MYRVDIYISENGASNSKYYNPWAFCMECIKRGEVHTRKDAGVVEGSQYKAVLTAMCKALARLNQSCEVHIYCENTFVISMYEKNLPKWVENGFLKANGKPVANKEEWQRLWKLTRGNLIKMEPGKHKYSKGDT